MAPTRSTAATAADAAAARDQIEEQARVLYSAALLYVANRQARAQAADTVAAEEEILRKVPTDQEILEDIATAGLVRTARSFANTLMRRQADMAPQTPVPPVGEARERWIEQQAVQAAKQAIKDATAHYRTVSKRVRREEPEASSRLVRSTFRADTVWAEAAARTRATGAAARTAMDMLPDVEKMTGEKHSKMWISRGDPKVRALHRTLHGRVRELGDAFHHWTDGKSLSYPGDPKAPLDAAINCRCSLFLVPTKDAGFAETVFFVPNSDFDVPVAAAGSPQWLMERAERELRSELAVGALP